MTVGLLEREANNRGPSVTVHLGAPNPYVQLCSGNGCISGNTLTYLKHEQIRHVTCCQQSRGSINPRCTPRLSHCMLQTEHDLILIFFRCDKAFDHLRWVSGRKFDMLYFPSYFPNFCPPWDLSKASGLVEVRLLSMWL